MLRADLKFIAKYTLLKKRIQEVIGKEKKKRKCSAVYWYITSKAKRARLTATLNLKQNPSLGV